MWGGAEYYYYIQSAVVASHLCHTDDGVGGGGVGGECGEMYFQIYFR